jgi:hypothetical protein
MTNSLPQAKSANKGSESADFCGNPDELPLRKLYISWLLLLRRPLDAFLHMVTA